MKTMNFTDKLELCDKETQTGEFSDNVQPGSPRAGMAFCFFVVDVFRVRRETKTRCH